MSRSRLRWTLTLLAALLLSAAPGPAAVAPAGTVQDRPERSRQGGLLFARAGEITPEKLERWRSMPPEEREKIRERYRRWKSLPPERRERIL